jgi:oligopeptide transport system ATP-binding protein
MSKNKEVVLNVKDLYVSLYTDKGRVKAIRGVSFDLYKGEILCIVGESGSGKSITAKTIMGILPPNGRIDGGEVNFRGEDLTKVSEEEFHEIRGKKIGMIFQDPLSSLNPIMRIGKQITEALIINSSKIKRKYQELISVELINYKNNQATKRVLLLQADAARENKIDELKEKRSELRANKQIDDKEKNIQLKQIQNDLKLVNAEYHKAKAKIIKEYNALIKEGKIALKKRQRTAKKEIKEYKAALYKERNDKILDLKRQLKSALPEEKSKIKKQIETVKREFTDSIKITRKAAKETAIKVMEEVGIPNAARRYRQYPFEFSGGMRQRIVIAIALTQNPDVLICDEPTTALDVTIQAQILELIQKLKKERQLSAIFITHDLGVVANMADRVAVMYAGKIVEYGLSEEVFYNPQHPYTWALLSSIPDLESKERLEPIPGTPPDMIHPPKGDAFSVRSRYAMAIDFKKEPPFVKVSDTHYAATWLLDERAPKVELPKIVTDRIKISLEKAGIKHGQ